MQFRIPGPALVLGLSLVLVASLLLADGTIFGQGLPPEVTPRPTPSATSSEPGIVPFSGVGRALASVVPAPVGPQGSGPLGGGGFTLRAGAQPRLSWQDGSQETGYLVLRWSPDSGFAFLPSPTNLLGPTASSFSDSDDLPDPAYCYVLLPLGGTPTSLSLVLGISDLLCFYPRQHTETPPGDFAVRLDQTTTAKLTWTAPGGQDSYDLLIRRFDGSGDQTLSLEDYRLTFQENTGGRASCYQLTAKTGATVLGRTDMLCAVPGVTSLSVPPATVTPTATVTPVATPTVATGGLVIATHPHIDETIERVSSQQTRVGSVVLNTTGRPMARFTLTFTGTAQTGSVSAATVQTDRPTLFDSTQATSPSTVTCTFTLRPGQALAPNETARLTCTYDTSPDAIVMPAERIIPPPFPIDTDYNQINDDLERAVAERLASDDPNDVSVLVALQQATAADLEVFQNTGGSITSVFPPDSFASFAGSLPPANLYSYAAAAGSRLLFIDPNAVHGITLDIAVQRTRVDNVHAGAYDGADIPDANLPFRNPDRDLRFEGESETTVAVIDTGLDASHPALAGRIRVSLDCNTAGCPAAAAADPNGIGMHVAGTDRVGHGSHVAGVVGAAVDLNHPSHPLGVASGVMLADLRWTGTQVINGRTIPPALSSGGSAEAIVNALNWVRANRDTHGIVAVNMSMTAPGALIPQEDEAVRQVVAAGVPVIAGAGNDFQRQVAGGSPGTSPYAITVGAVNDQDAVAFYSSPGGNLAGIYPGAAPKPDVVAPGGRGLVSLIATDPVLVGGRLLARRVQLADDSTEGIWSVASNQTNYAAGRDNYREMSGTSQAAPHVSGLAALIAQAVTDYANADEDFNGTQGEDPWDGVDNDHDDIIDEDPTRWGWLGSGPRGAAERAAAARLLKSVILMTAWRVAEGDRAPRWAARTTTAGGGTYEIIEDANGNGVKDAGEATVSSFARSAAGDLIYDALGNRVYDIAFDIIIPLAGSPAPSTADGAALTPAVNSVGTGGFVALFPRPGVPNAPPAAPRAAKDNVQGYGMVAADAAVEAVTKEFCATESDRFGAGLNDKKVWARHLHLYRNKEYRAILDVPATGDYDLYIYYGNIAPDATQLGPFTGWGHGEPILLAASVRAGNGVKEEVTFRVPQDGMYFMVVKRVTGEGEFFVRLVTPEEWTIMVYMPAELEGRNLDDLAFRAINDMEATGSGEESMKHFQVLVQVDYAQNAYDGRASHNGQAVRYCVRKDHDPDLNKYSIVRAVGDPGLASDASADPEVTEVDMGFPATLRKFVNWAIDYFPAEKYALILWGDGRGYGWKTNEARALGPGNDTTNSVNVKNVLSMEELRSSMAEVKTKIVAVSRHKPDTGRAKNLDILGFDMGHMALVEVAYQVQESVDIMVASEDRIDAPGWPYKEILAGLKGDTDGRRDADSFARHIVTQYGVFYSAAVTRDDKHTLSAIRLNPAAGTETTACGTFIALVACLDTFAGGLLNGVPDYQVSGLQPDNVQLLIKRGGRIVTEEMEDHTYIDLRHFAQNIRASGVPTRYKP